MTSRKSRFLVGLVAGLLVVAAPVQARAQAGGGDGYLFKPPIVAFSLRAGLSVPRAGSDLFSFTTQELTVEKSDFRAPMLEGRIAVRVNDRVDVMATVGGASSTTRSVLRDTTWLVDDGLPIAQTTSFRMMKLTFGGKAYLTGRGRRVGSLAWIPARFGPYLGADVGWVFHEFEQDGEFLDYASSRIDPLTGEELVDIVNLRLFNDGTAPTVQALAGLDVSLNNRVLLTTEARYGWASDELGLDFVGFDRLDLAGFQVSAGFTVRF